MDENTNVIPLRPEQPRPLGRLLADLKDACDELDRLINEPLPWPAKLPPGQLDPRD